MEEQVAFDKVIELVNRMSVYKTTEENEQIVAEIEEIAEKYKGKVDIQAMYALGLDKLTAVQSDAVSCQATVTKLEELSEIYQDNEFIQFEYANGLVNLTVVQENIPDILSTLDTLLSLKVSTDSIIPVFLYLIVRLAELATKIDSDDKDLIQQWQGLLGKCLDLGLDSYYTQDVRRCWEFSVEKVDTLQPLLLIWLSVREILGVLTVYFLEELLSNRSLAHYTRADSLQYFMSSKSDGFDSEFVQKLDNLRLRLNNADYMNDPQEGKTLLEYLGLADVRRGEGVWLNEASPVFFTSFTTETDNLPMWSQYTGNAQGVALLFKENFFNAKPWSIIDSLKSEDTSKRTEQYSSSSDGYLYHVCYIDKNDQLSIPTKDNNAEDVEKLKKEIEEIKNCIEELHKIVPEDDKKRIELDRTILALLDDIRYLFKSADYAYEHELRLVRFLHIGSDDIKQFKTDSMALPKLYVDYDKNIIQNIKEIKLGPKFENAHSVVPYIQHLNARIRKNNPITITRSKIDFR